MTDRPLVTVYDPLSWDHGWSYQIEDEALRSHGVDLKVPANADERDELARVAEIVISSSLVRFDTDVIASLESCIGILCYSSGMDAVDLAAARAAGISVANVQANTVEVAEHAMALLLAMHRRIPWMADAAAAGRWDLREFPEIWDIPRLAGRVAGIVGAGKVGRAVAERARGFGMKTIATYHSPPTDPERDLPHVGLDDLLATSDVIFLCASLNPDSRGIIDGRALSLVKPGMLLVNVARGGLVDEPALLDALESGRVAGAALDVRSPEPPLQPDGLGAHPNVIQTPHMAGASAQARAGLHEKGAEGALRLLADAGRIEWEPEEI